MKLDDTMISKKLRLTRNEIIVRFMFSGDINRGNANNAYRLILHFVVICLGVARNWQRFLEGTEAFVARFRILTLPRPLAIKH